MSCSVQGCQEAVHEDSLFCIEHRCSFPDCDNYALKCVAAKGYDEKIFCAQHMCSAPHCQNVTFLISKYLVAIGRYDLAFKLEHEKITLTQILHSIQFWIKKNHEWTPKWIALRTVLTTMKDIDNYTEARESTWYQKSGYCFEHKCQNTYRMEDLTVECENQRVDDAEYCKVHKCKVPGCPYSKHCRLHICKVYYCYNLKVQELDRCQQHICDEENCTNRTYRYYTKCMIHHPQEQMEKCGNAMRQRWNAARQCFSRYTADE